MMQAICLTALKTMTCSCHLMRLPSFTSSLTPSTRWARNIHDAVQAGGTFEHSHVNPNHFGAPGSRDETGFFGSHQSLSPLSNVVLPANAAVATGSSVTTLVTVNVPAIQGTLQVQPSGDLRPCTWRNNGGVMCGEMLSFNCQGHLATAHGITEMSRTTLVLCGACGSTLTRGSFLRHFREVHLRYPREN
ncbi:hypothetical protein EDC04DRAFT_448264 [Pisolithus marmoratus]|nr:hypothetical protein EDC04DRAFT_448264 [Pisolithus marmoratus]